MDFSVCLEFEDISKRKAVTSRLLIAFLRPVFIEVREIGDDRGR